MPDDLTALTADAEAALAHCEHRGWTIATAESCTGGLIAATLTDVPGSSSVVECGFVTYSNEAKTAMLGVPAMLIAAEGAVSRPVAEAMALGALDRSAATVAVACTGIAGPGGGSDTKPVGLVFVACARAGGACVVERHVFPGDRTSVRRATVRAALRMVREIA